ncbi:hypothetical protein IF202_00275 [Marinomonas sp. SM2066]|uniref:Tetrahydrofolate dehydrogenase/cyclohydrolase NAD(P)-binding domain-containing protein n=1 Tax=Marinomonas colpomeniae TaxID=2774408 RepID=A0ABR8NWC1_9GAMM|nr:hypothetical protein [Marinomonas colpomeniae]
MSVVGSSNIIRQPMIQLMLECNYTVSIAHTYTKDTVVFASTLLSNLIFWKHLNV